MVDCQATIHLSRETALSSSLTFTTPSTGSMEINNGRLAMLGIFSIISESKVPGSVPLITGLIPEYKGDYMVPFEADFSIFA